MFVFTAKLNRKSAVAAVVALALLLIAVILLVSLRSIGGIPVYTSKGIGASRIQWRVGVRPQIDVLTF